ncbi:MAG TPA: phosphotransferase [Streptosporangiaceae bacterium]|nr:phosphotransferase [Streptosporangiaceae bacterium]
MESAAAPDAVITDELSGYRLIEQFPTDQGRSVHVAETADGERVLIKRAYDKTWVQDLTDQTQHFLALHRVLGQHGPYPKVIKHGAGLLVMSFYPYGSLDDLSLGDDKPLVASLTAAAIGKLFEIAALRPAEATASQELASAADDFLTAQASKRMARLHRALATPAGLAWAAQRYDDRLTNAEALTQMSAWITGGALAASATKLGPPRLGLAAHGDFGLNNIMLAGPPTPEAGLIFIDTRGLWLGGLPWWDPVMDLATLLAFHCRIEPAFAAVGGRTAPEVLTAAARLNESEILDIAERSEAVAAWVGQDPAYRDRLEVEIAIRLLGSVSVQILTAPSHGAARATAVLRLYADQAVKVTSILSSYV